MLHLEQCQRLLLRVQRPGQHAAQPLLSYGGSALPMQLVGVSSMAVLAQGALPEPVVAAAAGPLDDSGPPRRGFHSLDAFCGGSSSGAGASSSANSSSSPQLSCFAPVVSSFRSSSSGGGSPPAGGLSMSAPHRSTGPRQRVAVGISGGVDSAVAAMLLKQQGHEVVGVFMRNWDEGEETGNQNCSVERDLRDAAAVCRQLGIPLHEADFVSKYWTQVFSEFVSQCARGLTPNPDLACNRHIKFDALLSFAEQLGADAVATGHYARVAWPTAAGRGASATAGSLAGSSSAAGPQLLRGLDRRKDQTYFLASVQQQALERVLFPVGGLLKPQVRQFAAEAGLVSATRRSSAGICFIGRRDFGDFLREYADPVPGRFVDVDTGADLGPCPNLLAVTHGQRPRLSGMPDRTYVAGKDVSARVAYLAHGHDHSALLCRTALLRTPHWLSPAHAAQLAGQGFLRCEYKARYGQEPQECILLPALGAGLPPTPSQELVLLAASPAAVPAGSSGGSASAVAALQSSSTESGFQPSMYCRLQPEDSLVQPGYLIAHFLTPAVAITPQQAFVVYDGEVCLGSAPIAMPGRTLYEEQRGTEALKAAPLAAAA